MSAPLLLLLLSLPSTDETTQTHVRASGNIGFASDSFGASIGQGGGTLDATFYFSSVVDDATPITLQPFRQRKSGIDLSAGASGESGTSSDGTRSASGSQTSVDVDVFGYPGGGSLYLWGDVGFGYSTQNNSQMGQTVSSQSEMILPLRLGVGWRVGDVLADFSWGVEPFRVGDGAFSIPDYYDVQLHLRAVILHREWLSIFGSAVHGGGSGELLYEHFFGRDLGVGASFAAGHGRYIEDDHPYTFAGGSVFVGLWFTHRVGINFEYRPEWTRAVTSATDSIVQHAFGFGFTGRF